jgi:Ca2+-binding RTX toxin-like protein
MIPLVLQKDAMSRRKRLLPMVAIAAMLGGALWSAAPAWGGVQCFGQPATRSYADNTLSGHQTFLGTSGPDVIVIRAGSYTSHDVDGRGGNDRICDKANDAGDGGEIRGGDGNDRLIANIRKAIYGGAGDDLAKGSFASEIVDGGAGHDRLYGRFGSGDNIYGRGGNDYLNGGSDGGFLDGGPGTDTCVNEGVGGSRTRCES